MPEGDWRWHVSCSKAFPDAPVVVLPPLLDRGRGKSSPFDYPLVMQWLLWVALAAPRAEPWVDAPLTVGAAVGWAALVATQSDASTSCPCDAGAVNALDRRALGLGSRRAEQAADALAVSTLAAAPLAALAALEPGDALLVAEAVALTGLLTGVSKRAVARPYPYLYDGRVDAARLDDGVNYASFWSGHTAAPMAAAVSLATLYQARHPRSAKRWVLWTVGPALAVGAGALQIAAGNHFPTDVLAGAAVGAAVGWAVPWAHTRWE